MSTFLLSGTWRRAEGVIATAIESPLGIVRLDALVNETLLSTNRVSSYLSNTDARLFVWNTPVLHAELVVCKPHLNLPNGMNVTDCRAAIWRIRAKVQPIFEFALTCRLEAAAPGQQPGSPCSGQGLEAIEWSDGKVNVTIGTQDAEAMVMSRKNGGIHPVRWTQELWGSCPNEVDLVEYANDGLVVRPPDFEPGEIAQFQFVVAWADEPVGDIANWYAVDLPSSSIISALRGDEN